MVVNEMIYLYAIRLEKQYSELDILSLLPFLSKKRVDKIKDYCSKLDQIRSILGESLLRYLLWNEYLIPSANIQFQYNRYGKPSLIEYENIYFSISHSGEWILCAVSDTPIGIDIEGGQHESIILIAKRFFTEQEYSYIIKQTLDNQKNAFYKLWTLKESYVKCIGRGLSIPLNSFYFEWGNEYIRMYEDGVPNDNYIFQSMHISDEYQVSVCSYRNKSSIRKGMIQHVSMDEIHMWCELSEKYRK